MTAQASDALARANREALEVLSRRRSALTGLKIDALELSLDKKLEREKGLRAYDNVSHASQTLSEEEGLRHELAAELARPGQPEHEENLATILDRLDALRRRERDAYYRDGAKVGDPCIPCLQKAIIDAEVKRLKKVPGMTEKKLKKAVKRIKSKLKHADIEVLKVINERLGTKVNFGALSRFEGGQWTRGYVPPAGRSGVTIATGFDVGQWRPSELRSKLDLPPELATRLERYTGHTRDNAVAQLRRHPLELTRDEANIVDRQVHQFFVRETMSRWDARRGAATPAYRELSSAQQTVLFSRSFHQGVGMPDTSVARNFYSAAQRNDWRAAEDHLRNYAVRPAWYRERVGAEAALLRGERAQNG